MATDIDIGINQEIEYFLESGHDNDFAIDRNTGSIIVARALSFGKKNYYRFKVRATDKGQGRLSGHTTVTINVKGKSHLINVCVPSTPLRG